jgi:hypothetical protein
MFGSALLQRRSWAGSGPSVGHSGLVWRLAAGDGRLQKHDGAAALLRLRISVRSPLRDVRRQWPLVPRWLGSTSHVRASRVKSHEGRLPHLANRRGVLLGDAAFCAAVKWLRSAVSVMRFGCPSSGGGARRPGRWVSLLWDWHWLRQGWKVRVTLLWWHWPLTGSWISENIV